MKLLTVLLITICVTKNYISCDHLVTGNVSNRVVVANQTRVEYNAIPFIKRVKQFFYSGTRNITGIQALDQLHSKASINITAGGVGHQFVNLRLKSERSLGLDYDIAIYVQEDFIPIIGERSRFF